MSTVGGQLYLIPPHPPLVTIILLKIKQFKIRPSINKYSCAILSYDPMMIFLKNNSRQLYYAPQSDIVRNTLLPIKELCSLMIVGPQNNSHQQACVPCMVGSFPRTLDWELSFKEPASVDLSGSSSV